ncbi:unnamed protein product [Allacma fusca]|uniref:Dehydrogenase/reductase SDR family member 7 n=1 Tax=Allacma fusca TaxID=39272 RepID=A0A8J2L6Y2_9HEXA|nr:unnamed protein product [Allacma fusca]
MDLIYLAGLLTILYFLTCVILSLIIDSDIITFLMEKYGKTSESEYKGKVIWLTGASGGIGEAIAKEFAKCGAKLALSARRHDQLERVKTECLAQNSSLKNEDILVLPLDMVDLKSHEPAFQRMKEKFGKVDVFISNAGRSQRANWKGGGQVGVVSGISGKAGFPHGGSYSGSKHAIQGYFNSLRMEMYGKNVDVTLLCPGPVYTDIGENAFTTKPGEKAHKKILPTDKRMTPERCAQLALVALANRLNESWIALPPVVPVLYFLTYFPLLSSAMMKLVGVDAIVKAMVGKSVTPVLKSD